MAEVNEAKREKSQVEDINRSLYDFRYEEKDAYKVDAGLTPAIVEQISREKNDPDWMLERWRSIIRPVSRSGARRLMS